MTDSINHKLPNPLLRIILLLGILITFYVVIFLLPNNYLISNQSESISVEKSQELLTLSRTYISQHKYLEALTLTQQLCQAYPNNHIYLDQLATIYKNLAQPQKQAETLEQFLKVAPIPSEACPELQDAYHRQNNFNKMIDVCQRCLILEPNNGDFTFYLAHAYELAQQYDKAQQTYLKGLTLNPNYLDNSVGLARIYFAQNNIKEAKQLLLAVLAKNPNFVDALLLIGIIENKQDHNSRAKEYLKKGVLITPHYLDFYLVLGGIAEQEKDPTTALQYYDQALKFEPDNKTFLAKCQNLMEGK